MTPINIESLLDNYDGDHAVATEMLYCFRDMVPGFINELREYARESDRIATLKMVRKIHNISACAHVVSVQDKISELEFAAKAGDMDSVRNIVPQLEEKCNEALSAINSHGK